MDERFANALNFVAVQLRRLEADSNAVDPIHWHIKNWESLLWALQQQAQIVRNSFNVENLLKRE